MPIEHDLGCGVPDGLGPMMLPSLLRRCLVAVVLGLVVVTAAHAHGMLKRASPRAGSTIAALPTEVRLQFKERVEPAFSSIEVRNAAGDRVDGGKIRADPADAAALQVSLQPLTPGIYRVTWRAVSVDTHVTSGEFRFDYRPE